MVFMSVSLPVGTIEIYSVLNCKVWLKDLNGLRVSFTEEVDRIPRNNSPAGGRHFGNKIWLDALTSLGTQRSDRDINHAPCPGLSHPLASLEYILPPGE